MRPSPWLTTPARAFAPPSRDVRVDVAVVGGGVSGVTVAVLLKQRGYTVALLERGRLGGGDTGHTTAHLTAVTDRPPHDLLAAFGPDHAGAIWDAGYAALDQIDRLVRSRRIRCGFDWVPGVLHVRPGHPRAAEDAEDLRQSLAACDTLGIDAEWVDGSRPSACPGCASRSRPAFGRISICVPWPANCRVVAAAFTSAHRSTNHRAAVRAGHRGRLCRLCRAALS